MLGATGGAGGKTPGDGGMGPLSNAGQGMSSRAAAPVGMGMGPLSNAGQGMGLGPLSNARQGQGLRKHHSLGATVEATAASFATGFSGNLLR